MKRLGILFTFLISPVITTMNARAESFSFKSYERRIATDTDVAGATRDIEIRLPIGSPISSYACIRVMSIVSGRIVATLIAERFHDVRVTAMTTMRDWTCSATAGRVGGPVPVPCNADADALSTGCKRRRDPARPPLTIVITNR